MIEIIPAIDVYEGKCVRLTEGQFGTVKVYNQNPLDVAKYFQHNGVKKIHLVDLEGAKEGRIKNAKVLRDIASNTDLSIDFGGGIRSSDDLQMVLDAGAKQVNIGSIAVTDPELLFSWINQYSKDIFILSPDVKNGYIAIHGWQDSTAVTLDKFFKQYIAQGISHFVCTDISKDGRLQGPNFALYKELTTTYKGAKIIASGGISSVADIEQLDQTGVYGAILGKALYEYKITLNDLGDYLC
ncbi:MAG: 1-(5-phosphoribosyl)-5-[(5-phosphoribosylamino)methylideneamino]imidazole-4-carboxamide isomerase [Bacteriovoracaceae bacterium]|nr:1-(5-phosphoribosyl)-5-[(5-phosphoribosylamino)methylideneamino]imidazole-4-carboxamide isomerase [Bacteriovoracaceae bacterium]